MIVRSHKLYSELLVRCIHSIIIVIISANENQCMMLDITYFNMIIQPSIKKGEEKDKSKQTHH